MEPMTAAGPFHPDPPPTAEEVAAAPRLRVPPGKVLPMDGAARHYNRGTSTLQATVLRLDPDMHAAVKARAEAEERTMAQVMRRALRAYLATEVR